VSAAVWPAEPEAKALEVKPLKVKPILSVGRTGQHCVAVGGRETDGKD
jgi:hypothetical protein